jgi:hypothetical protein
MDLFFWNTRYIVYIYIYISWVPILERNPSLIIFTTFIPNYGNFLNIPVLCFMFLMPTFVRTFGKFLFDVFINTFQFAFSLKIKK